MQEIIPHPFFSKSVGLHPSPHGAYAEFHARQARPQQPGRAERIMPVGQWQTHPAQNISDMGESCLLALCWELGPDFTANGHRQFDSSPTHQPQKSSFDYAAATILFPPFVPNLRDLLESDMGSVPPRSGGELGVSANGVRICLPQAMHVTWLHPRSNMTLSIPAPESSILYTVDMPQVWGGPALVYAGPDIQGAPVPAEKLSISVTWLLR
ncbi:hypothetical protein FZEAL_1830 [Fusarium zealandicum]|uniref:Uncharacterized protein n=1 Tax=Fusarium zealandicum TaxID=1053134 RepID=A0A8H4USR7_9HYPO|nr:hypothetical protein FZEAL_1830 [Fusarium zealandicum]